MMDTQTYIRQYWRCVAVQDEESLKQYFYKDAVIRWHNTNEQFNVNEYLRANCDYPGNWSAEVERIVQTENTIISVTRIWTKELSFHVTSFFEITNGEITTLDEYWGDDGEAPTWRQDLHIGNPIR